MKDFLRFTIFVALAGTAIHEYLKRRKLEQSLVAAQGEDQETKVEESAPRAKSQGQPTARSKAKSTPKSEPNSETKPTQLSLPFTEETDVKPQPTMVDEDAFNTALYTVAPTITSGEMKLAQCIRQGMDNKQIAAALSMNPDAIKKGRYRLRKKLPLTTTDSLEDYICGL